MNFLRRLASYLFFPAAIAAILALVALLPPVQTWLVQWWLNTHPEWHVTVGSVTARFGEVEILDLRAETAAGVFKAPQLKARLPILAAVLGREASLRSLTAKGWSLDLGNAASHEPTAALPRFAGLVHEVLQNTRLPYDFAVENVDAEGDVFIPLGEKKSPAQVRLKLTGGGLGSGREGTVAVSAEGSSLEPVFHVVDLATHGQLAVRMPTPRTIDRLSFKADVQAKAGAPVRELGFSVDATAARDGADETFALAFTQGERHPLHFTGRWVAASSRLQGSWKLDLTESDIAPFTAMKQLPNFAVGGDGTWECSSALTDFKATGRFSSSLDRLGGVAAGLRNIAATKITGEFDLALAGAALRVTRLDVSLLGAQPIASLRALQSFDFNFESGAFVATKPRDDLAQLAFQELPLAWLPLYGQNFAFEKGVLKGNLTLRAGEAGLEFRQDAPFTASGVAIARAGKTVAQDLALAFSITGRSNATSWEASTPQLTIDSADHRRLAALVVDVSRRFGANQPLVIHAKTTLDLSQISQPGGWPELAGIEAGSITADFTTTLERSTKLEGQFSIAGLPKIEAASAQFKAEIGANGVMTFNAPVKIATVTGASTVTVDGSWWASERSGGRVTLRLGSQKVALEHLQSLAPLAAAWAGVPLRSKTASSERDSAPFWGNNTGRISIAFDELQIAESVFKNVRGALDLDRNGVRVSNGMYTPADTGLAQLEGSLLFDAAADVPYRLQATTSSSDIDAGPLFGVPGPDKDPLFKGRFSVDTSFSGAGTNFPDLIARTEQHFKLKSTNGIIRLLGVSVSDALPKPPPTPMSDAVGDVGSVVGAFFGFKGSGSGEIRLAKNTDAVLGYTYHMAEIGYQEMTIAATRGADHTLRITELNIVGPLDRITGTGQIGGEPGRSLLQQPMSLDLTFAVRGQIATLLAPTHLLSGQKDSLDYSLLTPAIQFGGSLAAIDKKQWHDVLAAAAQPLPDPGKKSEKTPAKK